MSLQISPNLEKKKENGRSRKNFLEEYPDCVDCFGPLSLEYVRCSLHNRLAVVTRLPDSNFGHRRDEMLS